jgi:hypothetical protein
MLEPKQAQFETTESKPAEFTEENKAKQSDHRVDQALGIFKDLRALEVTPTSQVAAHEILSAISVRRPRNNEFIRVDPEKLLTTVVWENKKNIGPISSHLIFGLRQKGIGLGFDLAPPLSSGENDGDWLSLTFFEAAIGVQQRLAPRVARADDLRKSRLQLSKFFRCEVSVDLTHCSGVRSRRALICLGG